MSATDPRVDAFLRHVQLWPKETAALREVLLTTELVEDYKWGQPCYVLGRRNVALIGGFKDSLRLSFFKGALLRDPHNVLEFAGPNSRSVKFMRYTSINDIQTLHQIILAYCSEAIALEQHSSRIAVPKAASISIPIELEEAFDDVIGLREAFFALTPGRQRGYLMYFTSAKHSTTRQSRIDKYVSTIMAGKGLHD